MKFPEEMKIELLCDLAVLLLNIYSKKMKMLIQIICVLHVYCSIITVGTRCGGNLSYHQWMNE